MDFVLVFERKDKTCDISSSKSCYYVYERLGVWTMAHTGWFFWLVRPIFSTKMKNDGRPIRDSVPWNFRCTKDPRWSNNVFLFSTEIWADQLKKPPCICLQLTTNLSFSSTNLLIGAFDCVPFHHSSEFLCSPQPSIPPILAIAKIIFT